MKWQGKEIRIETRASIDYTDELTRYLLARAGSTAADVGATAAAEVASGLLSRELMAARVEGPAWAQSVLSPQLLGGIGRGLVRHGSWVGLIDVRTDGSILLTPAASWDWHGDSDPATWRITAQLSGPSGDTTKTVHYDGVVFVSWGHRTGIQHEAIGPLDWAELSGKTGGCNSERVLGDELSGPIAQVVTLPVDGGDTDSPDDPLAALKADISKARGRLRRSSKLFAQDGAPDRAGLRLRTGCQVGSRPRPPAPVVAAAKEAYERALAACGCWPALAVSNADGTAQRESLRRYRLGTVAPLVRQLEHELNRKLEPATPIRIKLDRYALDLVGRSQSLKRLVDAGVSLQRALEIAGLEG